ncbi:MAG: hypothetical protein HFI36_01635 [Bacilli bacterium]|jgi:hypothetical protein|nr:hypothetical protein [Bacilli bacterium]
MIKEELIKELSLIENELLIIEDELSTSKTLPSLNAFYFKWRLNKLRENINAKEETINSKFNKNLKLPIYYIITCLIILIVLLIAMLKESLLIFFADIFLAFIFLIFILPKKKKRLLYKASPTTELIKKLYKDLERNNIFLKDIKITYNSNEKKLSEKLIMEMFDEANNHISDMINKEIVNVNYKDREYRKFLINLYDLKIGEKDLNIFYRNVIKILLEKDLNI